MSKGSVSPAERSKSPEASEKTDADVYKAEGIKDSPERKSGIKPGAKMGKADEPFEKEGSASASSGSASPEASASGEAPPVDAPPAGPEGSALPPGPDASAAPAPEGSMPPPGPEGSMPPAGPEGEQAQMGPSMEELVSLYAALPPEDFEAHAAAMQQAMAMKQGAAPGPQGMPPPGPGASPSPAPSPSAPPAFKSEKVDALEAELKKTQSELAAVAAAFEQVLTIPQRKAHTGIQYIQMQPVAKAEKPAKKAFADLTKSELHAACMEMTGAESKLTKAEREVITKFFVTPAKSEVLVALEGIYNKS